MPSLDLGQILKVILIFFVLAAAVGFLATQLTAVVDTPILAMNHLIGEAHIQGEVNVYTAADVLSLVDYSEQGVSWYGYLDSVAGLFVSLMTGIVALLIARWILTAW